MEKADGDLSDFDIHRIMEALSTRKSSKVASCALSIKVLLTEIQQQLLDLMVDGDKSPGSPLSNISDVASDDPNDEDYKVPGYKPSSSSLGDGEDDEDGDADADINGDMEITQDSVVTGATVPITGSRLRSPNPYHCQECSAVFATKKALSRHMTSLHNEKGDSDDRSEEPSKSADQSENGNDEEDNEETLKDPLKIKIAFPKSASTSPSQTRVACEVCGTQTLKQHMARHMLSHSDVKPFPCDECDAAFSRKDKLKEHMKKHAKGYNPKHKSVKQAAKPKAKAAASPKTLKCRKCDYTTTNKNEMKVHRDTHPAKMVFKCDHCEKEFTCNSHLAQHVIKHRNEKPYMCDMCGVSFSREPNLARHIRSHTNPAPYHCKFCNKPYHRNNELVVHERTHTGEKPYICEICGNGHASSKYLKRHLFTHTGLKPYKCDLCERAFARPENMRAHRKLHDKASNRLAPPADSVSSAFHASKLSVGATAPPRFDPVENSLNSSHDPDMYEFPTSSSLNSTGRADHSALGGSPTQLMPPY